MERRPEVKTLITIKAQDVFPDAPVIDTSNFTKREAARGVVLNDKNEVVMLAVDKHHYHKLAGGGIDPGETKEEALHREMLEEVGCKVEIIAELGQIVEYRDEFKICQTSYCYLTREIGERVEATPEPGEIEDQQHEFVAPNIDEAIKILEKDETDEYDGKFIKIRDIVVLKAAKEALK